ncbi:hypothetical protein H072_11326 [Dactylellina haptotyla CBS 200.50]|uniref:Peptidase M13 N-terminal domain-containing protein n=1 Tax=Dactylellina haptotyla (strain CBS 200.50) TaxID=1284197 RepID=S8A2C7_DACHA|nr:hypothetical protein H072_11326 [Dactylellina haptotyla CBS 200.50]
MPENGNTNSVSEQTPLLGRDVEEGADSESFLVRTKNWLSRNFLVIALTTLIIVLVAVVIVLAPRIDYSPPARPPLPPPKGPSKVPTCTTPGCVLAAATLLRSMSKRYKDLDACEDFRTFTCEGFDVIYKFCEN